MYTIEHMEINLNKETSGKKMSKIRIILIEDHTVLRETIAIALNMENEFDVIGHWGSGEDALKSVADKEFDIAVVDRMLPGMDGIVLTKRIREKYPDASVIMLSMVNEEQRILEAFEAGVRGYLLKDVPISEVIDSIKRVHRGEMVIQKSLTENLITFFSRIRDSKGFHDILTDEQMKVLTHASEGLTNKEIADKLGLPLPIIKLRFREIFHKLNARHRTHAIMKAVKLGILTIEE